MNNVFEPRIAAQRIQQRFDFKEQRAKRLIRLAKLVDCSILVAESYAERDNLIVRQFWKLLRGGQRAQAALPATARKTLSYQLSCLMVPDEVPIFCIARRRPGVVPFLLIVLC